MARSSKVGLSWGDGGLEDLGKLVVAAVRAPCWLLALLSTLYFLVTLFIHVVLVRALSSELHAVVPVFSIAEIEAPP